MHTAAGEGREEQINTHPLLYLKVTHTTHSSHISHLTLIHKHFTHSHTTPTECHSVTLLFAVGTTANTIGGLTMCCIQKHKNQPRIPPSLPIHPIQLQYSPHLTKHHSHLPAPSSFTHTEPSSLNGECNRGQPAHPTQPHPTTATRPGHPMRGSTINCTTPHSSPPHTQQRTSNNGRINGSKLLKLEIRPLIFTLIQCV